MSNKKTQRKFKPEFKLNVVLESYATGNVAATAERNDIHISQLNQWRKKLLTSGAQTFVSRRANKSEYQRRIDQLEKIIGRITVEKELLKKTRELLA